MSARMLSCLTGVVLAGSPAVLRAQAQSSVPPKTTYQARLEHLGVPYEGDIDLTFRLYDVGGTTALWTETQQAVPVSGGVVSVLLGATMDLDPADFSGETELEVTVGDETLPRVPLVSVPYAFKAELALNAQTLGGFSESHFNAALDSHSTQLVAQTISIDNHTTRLDAIDTDVAPFAGCAQRGTGFVYIPGHSAADPEGCVPEADLGAGGGGGLTPGMIAAFNRAACPAGWSELVPARGRYLVGAPGSSGVGAQVGQALTDQENRAVGRHTHGVTDPGHTHRVPLNNTGGVTAGSQVSGHVVNDGTWEVAAYVDTQGTGVTVNQEGAAAGTNAPYLQVLWCSYNGPDGGGGGSLWSPNGADIFYTAGSVGIGTTTPAANRMLHIVGPATRMQRTDDPFILELGRVDATPSDGDALASLEFQGPDSAGDDGVYAAIQGVADAVADGAEQGSLRFYTRSGGTFAERVRVTPSGAVGLGTPSPNARLEIGGSEAYWTPLKSIRLGNAGGHTTDMDWIAGGGLSGVMRLQGAGGGGAGSMHDFEWFLLDTGGTLGKRMRLNGNGNLYLAGTFAGGPPDLAENVPTSDPELAPGDLVAIDPSYRPAAGAGPYDRFGVARTRRPYEPGLLGAISGEPGILLHAGKEGLRNGATSPAGQAALALVGRIPVKVSTEGGVIEPGDRITSSSLPGIGMKASAPGPTLGIALERFDGKEPDATQRPLGNRHVAIGRVLVFLNPGTHMPVDVVASIRADSDREIAELRRQLEDERSRRIATERDLAALAGRLGRIEAILGDTRQTAGVQRRNPR